MIPSVPDFAGRVSKTRFPGVLAVLLICAFLPACRPGAIAPTRLPSANPSMPTIKKPEAKGSQVSPSLPLEYLQFDSLADLEKAARFPIWLPTALPVDLTFSKAWIANYAGGDQNVRLLYTAPGSLPDANLKSFDLQMTFTDEVITKDTLLHQSKAAALDVRQVPVRGQTGYTYWVPSGAAGNVACLAWREGRLNILISLFGDWPQPDGKNPHGLDPQLLRIAESLQVEK
jgi:hypothetical protein